MESRKSNKNVVQKKAYIEKCNAFGRFNEWERQIRVKPDSADCLAVVFELYDLVPDEAKQRPVNVEGIIKMRKDLACLGFYIKNKDAADQEQ